MFFYNKYKMLGLSLNFNTVIIIILGYVLYNVIINKKKHQDIEGFEVRPPPSPEDKEDKRYKPALNQKIVKSCGNVTKDYCLPLKKNEIPDDKYSEPISDDNNLRGHDFLNAGYHSQINKVGNYKGNKKVDIRPELINPQYGVTPTTQSIINIDFKNVEDVQLYSQNYSDIWKRLI